MNNGNLLLAELNFGRSEVFIQILRAQVSIYSSEDLLHDYLNLLRARNDDKVVALCKDPSEGDLPGVALCFDAISPSNDRQVQESWGSFPSNTCENSIMIAF